MSKKHKKQHGNSPLTNPIAEGHVLEYGVIRNDLIRVALLNTLYLALVLVLYFTNAHSHYLDNWFARILHF